MKQLTKDQKTILQLVDDMITLENHLREKDQLDLMAASCLDWQFVVDDQDVIDAVNELRFGYKKAF